MRDEFGQYLVELCEKKDELVVLDADVGISTKSCMINDKFSDRFLQIGIAEQNMIGIAAGISKLGLIPIVTGFGVFITRRAYEQICIACSYAQSNVKIFAGYSGISAGRAGVTHQAIDEIALINAIPNMIIMSPSSPSELKQCMELAVEVHGNVYIRIPKESKSIVDNKEISIEIGKGYIIEDGKDIAILTTGIMLDIALEVRNLMMKKGYSVLVAHFPTIKPIDTELIKNINLQVEKIITIEDHILNGGFGSIVKSILCEKNNVKLKSFGIDDTFLESGSIEELYEKYSLDSKSIVKELSQWIKSDEE